MIAAAYNQHAYYLQTLSFFSARLKAAELRDGLLNCKTAQEAYDLLAQQDLELCWVRQRRGPAVCF